MGNFQRRTNCNRADWIGTMNEINVDNNVLRPAEATSGILRRKGLKNEN